MTIESIQVKLFDEVVGYLTWDDAQHRASFEYTEEFIRSGLEPSPFMMPASSKIYMFHNLTRTKTFDGLPGLIADSLPEKYGNKVLEAWLNGLGEDLSKLTPLDRLALLGSRGMGALEYEPDTNAALSASEDIKISELVSTAQRVLDGRNNTKVAINDNDNDKLTQLVSVGTSAGGAKAKAIIAWNKKTNAIRSGQVSAPKGFEQWLIKFDEFDNEEHASSKQIGRIEYAYSLMAKLCGIKMMACELMTDGGLAHFLTKRFDRTENGDKLHIHTFCGMMHADRDPVGEYGYEDLFTCARRLGLKRDALTELYRRMVFNIVFRNQDDHTKNHAFIMDQQGLWQLSPAYDLCFSYEPGNRYIAKHQMSCNQKRDDFSIDDLLEAAKKANLKKKEALVIIEEVVDVASRWDQVADVATMDEKVMKAIRTTFRLF